MNVRVVFGGLALLIAAGLAFVVGRLMQPSDQTARQEPAVMAVQKPEPLAPTPAVAPPPSVPSYDHFRVGNRNIKAILADGEIMWVGTSGGVIRYDVKRDDYTLFDNRSGLLSNGVFHLSKVDGQIWVGTYGGGLSILDPKTGRWRNYNVPNGMGDAFIYDAIKTKSGDVWFATWSGANRVAGGALDDLDKWQLFTVENTKGGLPNDWVYGLAEGKNGEVWLATEGGLARYKDGEWTNWNHRNGLGASYEEVKAAIPFRNDPGAQSSHHAIQKKEQGLEGVDVAYNPNYIIALLVGDDGRVWAGTWGGGLSIFDGKTWKTYTTKNGLPANHIFMLRKDRAGNIWIGTNNGLARFDGRKFEVFTKADGLFSDVVFSIAFAEDGATWVGSFGGVARFYKGLRQAAAK
jgi:ligand-binding sensor domain-containing protein